MRSRPLLRDLEYELLKEFSNFSLVKDSERYKTGRVLTESEIPLVRKLAMAGYMVTGVHEGENHNLVPTASITPIGETVYYAERKRRRAESSSMWNFLYRLEASFA